MLMPVGRCNGVTSWCEFQCFKPRSALESTNLFYHIVARSTRNPRKGFIPARAKFAQRHSRSEATCNHSGRGLMFLFLGRSSTEKHAAFSAPCFPPPPPRFFCFPPPRVSFLRAAERRQRRQHLRQRAEGLRGAPGQGGHRRRAEALPVLGRPAVGPHRGVPVLREKNAGSAAGEEAFFGRDAKGGFFRGRKKEGAPPHSFRFVELEGEPLPRKRKRGHHWVTKTCQGRTGGLFSMGLLPRRLPKNGGKPDAGAVHQRNFGRLQVFDAVH